MPCYHPVPAWKPLAGPGVFFSPGKAGPGSRKVDLPCGQCIGCRLDRSREWALRCVHEAQQHEANCFLTLTYSDECLPDDYSVSVYEMQCFMKRLRKYLSSLGLSMRYLYCGEYGGKTFRPHYHALIFGYDFPDRTIWRKTSAGSYTYRSAVLDSLWSKGHAEIGLFSYASAAYVARYCLKKVTGDVQVSHYERVHSVTGELCRVLPEFCRMSNRPGIGGTWFEKYSADAFPSDFLVHDGSKHKVPRFYMKLLERSEAAAPADTLLEVSDKVGIERVRRAAKHAANNTPSRLAVREEVQKRKAAMLLRNMESGHDEGV